MRLGLFFCLTFILLSCKKNHEMTHENFRSIKIDEIPQDFQVPSQLWDQIQHKSAPDQEDTIIFLPISVNLKEKNPGILKSNELSIEFPRGGGLVDLSQWVTQENGTFFLKFDLSEFKSFEKVEAYFYSRARKRKVDDEVLGMGCNKFSRLSPPFLKLITTEGLAVNTTRNRHLTVIGGRWIFVARDLSNKIYISQVTIADSNEKDMFCKEPVRGAESN